MIHRPCHVFVCVCVCVPCSFTHPGVWGPQFGQHCNKWKSNFVVVPGNATSTFVFLIFFHQNPVAWKFCINLRQLTLDSGVLLYVKSYVFLYDNTRLHTFRIIRHRIFGVLLIQNGVLLHYTLFLVIKRQTGGGNKTIK